MNNILIALWISIILNVFLLVGMLFFASEYIKLRKKAKVSGSQKTGREE